MLDLMVIKQAIKIFKGEQDNLEVQQCYSHHVQNPIKISTESKKKKKKSKSQPGQKSASRNIPEIIQILELVNKNFKKALFTHSRVLRKIRM